MKKDLSWEVRTDDIFPLGDNDHNYWSGYFTSRPSLKKQVGDLDIPVLQQFCQLALKHGFS